MSNESKTTTAVRRGSVAPIPAKYLPQSVPIYQGNPLIEALPEQPGMKELIKNLSCKPDYDRKRDTGASEQARKEMAESLKFVFQPLPRHLHLADGMFSMIRKGYVTRNPSWGRANAITPEGSLESAALAGASGTGKTLSIRRVLRLIPQVIHHTNYTKVEDETQLAWLRVECPHDASPRGLCATILEKVDEVLGTDYSSEYGGSRSTTNSMIPGVITVVREHYLGLLIIDEIQNLFRRNTQASDELEDFIVRIINDLHVPVLMIGTYESAAKLQKSFRVTRRLTGLPQPNWGRLVETDPEWKLFTDTLWRYQYVQKESPLTPELRHFLFDLTQGIPDLLAKLYYLAQRHAIVEGIEEVTPQLLKQVSDEALCQNKKYLDALRAGISAPDEYVAENIWNQTEFSGMPPGKEKKDKQRRRNPRIEATLFETSENGSTMEAAKKAGMVFSEDDAQT